MLVIRLFRVGKKNQPSFKIVVTDKRKPPRAGRFVEGVGFYNPLTKEKVLKAERIKYWLSVGAKPSATVYNLLVTERMKVGEGGDESIASATLEKIIEGKKIPVHKKAKKEKEEIPVKEKPAEEKPKEEPKKEEKPNEVKPKEEAPKEEAPKTE